MASKGCVLVFSHRRESFQDIARRLPGYEVADAYAGFPQRTFSREPFEDLLTGPFRYDMVITTHQDPVLLLYDRGYEDQVLGLSASLEGLLTHNLLPDDVCKDASLLVRKVDALIASYRVR